MHTELIYLVFFLGLLLLILPDHYIQLPINRKHKQIVGIIFLLSSYYYFNNEKLF